MLGFEAPERMWDVDGQIMYYNSHRKEFRGRSAGLPSGKDKYEVVLDRTAF